MSLFQISEELPAGHVGGGDGAVVLIVSGEIDYGASPRLRERILDHIKAGRRRLVLDLSMVSFIDSTAIGVLVGAVARLQEAGGGSLAIVCAEENERVLRIFDIGGVASLIPLHHSREDALSALATAWPVAMPPWVEHATAGAAVDELRLPVQPPALGAVRKYAEDAAAARGCEPDATGRRGLDREIDELA